MTFDQDFTSAFNAISRVALPFMAADAYFSDLMHDADNAMRLEEGEFMYLLVRSYGTNYFSNPVEAIQHCSPRMCDGRAVLKIKRGGYGRFDIEVIFDIEMYQIKVGA